MMQYTNVFGNGVIGSPPRVCSRTGNWQNTAQHTFYMPWGSYAHVTVAMLYSRAAHVAHLIRQQTGLPGVADPVFYHVDLP